MDDQSTRVDRMDARSTKVHQAHVSIKRHYNGPDRTARGASGPSDQDSKDAIESVFKRLSTDQIQAVHHDPTVVTYLKRSTMDCSMITVDRNDRTVTPKNTIK